MKNYDVILFDLDGTITNSAPGIINSVQYSLKKCGIENIDKSSLLGFIGPPLSESFDKILKPYDIKTDTAVEYYREYYREKGIFENAIYPGVEDTLSALFDANKTLAVCTSKPEPFAKRIIEHFGLLKYFTLVAGATFDDTRSAKADVLNYALESLNPKDMSKVLMVGDRMHDIIGAKTVGVDSLGVLYGYGSLEELNEYGANYIAETAKDIQSLLLKSKGD